MEQININTLNPEKRNELINKIKTRIYDGESRKAIFNDLRITYGKDKYLAAIIAKIIDKKDSDKYEDITKSLNHLLIFWCLMNIVIILILKHTSPGVEILSLIFGLAIIILLKLYNYPIVYSITWLSFCSILLRLFRINISNIIKGDCQIFVALIDMINLLTVLSIVIIAFYIKRYFYPHFKNNFPKKDSNGIFILSK
jgi:uncharacterized membrane protein